LQRLYQAVLFTGGVFFVCVDLFGPRSEEAILDEKQAFSFAFYKAVYFLKGIFLLKQRKFLEKRANIFFSAGLSGSCQFKLADNRLLYKNKCSYTLVKSSI